MTPPTRKEGFVVKELPDEILVYDTERHEAHCLNPTAAFVWKHCDGEKSVKQIAELLRAELDVRDAEELVWWALHRLGKARLLTEPASPPPKVAGRSRRELVRRLGLVGGLSVLIPVVSSIDRADSCRSGGNMRAHRRVRRPARRDALRPPLHEDLSIWRLLLTAARRDAPLWRVADASDSAPPLARG